MFVLCSDYEGMPLALIEAMARVARSSAPIVREVPAKSFDKATGFTVSSFPLVMMPRWHRQSEDAAFTDPLNVLQDAVKDFHANRVAIRYEDLAAELLPERSQHLVMLVGPVAPPAEACPPISNAWQHMPARVLSVSSLPTSAKGAHRTKNAVLQASSPYFIISGKQRSCSLHLAHPVKLLIACWARMAERSSTRTTTAGSCSALIRGGRCGLPIRWCSSPRALWKTYAFRKNRCRVIPAYLPSRPRSGVGAGVAARLQGDTGM